jgi:hypothetical protein
MKTMVITRKELTTYSTVVNLPDEEADALMGNPYRLADLCPATDSNWVDAEDAEYEVEELDEEA